MRKRRSLTQRNHLCHSRARTPHSPFHSPRLLITHARIEAAQPISRRPLTSTVADNVEKSGSSSSGPMIQVSSANIYQYGQITAYHIQNCDPLAAGRRGVSSGMDLMTCTVIRSIPLLPPPHRPPFPARASLCPCSPPQSQPLSWHPFTSRPQDTLVVERVCSAWLSPTCIRVFHVIV